MREPTTVQVVVEHLTAREASSLEAAIHAVNGLQSQFGVSTTVRPIELPGKRYVKMTASFDALERRAKKTRIFCITPRPFRTNDFQQVNERCSLLTIGDWEELYAPPSLQTYIVYQFAFAFITWAANHVSERTLNHKRTLGCRNDFCRNKDDLKLGMMAGYICPQCQRQMLQLDATPEQITAIERILDYVQAAIRGQREAPDDWNTAFVVMRFSDDENEIFQQAIKPGLEDAGLVVQRADDRVEPRPLLEKISHQIRHARYIVAKVDTKRLNIYYELGVAMGGKKDVLLIAEHGSIKNLPSDLSNWECLTYRKGDHSGLRKLIAKFYRDNFMRQDS